MEPEAVKFAHVLTEEIYKVKRLEKKPIQVVQDELGYAMGREGGSAIEYWRRGHVPADLEDLETLTKELSGRSRMEPERVEALLKYGGHPYPAAVVNQLFPAAKGTKHAPVKRTQSEMLLLKRVENFWIEGVLAPSLLHVTAINIEKQPRPDAILQPWTLPSLPAVAGQQDVTLKHTSISTLFEDTGQSLLILGAPGSGKSTLLLQLARTLLRRAHTHSHQAVPIVLHLASWRHGHALLEWAISELNEKYLIPRHIGRQWLETDALTLLLDGLDEVPLPQRAACINAINAYRRRHMAGIAVCCRLEAYQQAGVKLNLDYAVALQPLSTEQVRDALLAMDNEHLYRVWRQNEELQAFLTTPLLLHILLLVYREETAVDPPNSHDQSQFFQQLLEAYVHQLYLRRSNHALYSDEETITWLTWLAQRLQTQGQSILYIEQIQPGWLSDMGQRSEYLTASRLAAGLAIGALFGVAIYPFAYPSLNPPLFATLIAIIAGVVGGLGASLIDVVFRLVAHARGIRAHISRFFYLFLVTAPGAVSMGLLGWVIGWPVGNLHQLVNHPTRSARVLFAFSVGTPVGALLEGPVGGVLGALLGGMASFFVFGLRGSRRPLRDEIQTVVDIGWSWRKAVQGVGFGLLLGVLFLFALNSQVGLVLGTIFGFGLGLLSGVNGRSIELRTRPNQGILLSVKSALLSGAIVGLISGMTAWLLSGPAFGFVYGVVAGGVTLLGNGGLDVMQHYILRFVLWRNKKLPWRLAKFLDYAVSCGILQQVGSGYLFRHHLILDYLAQR